MNCEAVDTVDDASFGYWHETWGDSPVHEFPCDDPAATITYHDGQVYHLCVRHAS